MTRQKGQKFADKHGSNTQLNERIKDHITGQVKNNELPCALAFKIADELNVSAAEVGKTADLLEIALVKCQLGLFGYSPEKKIVKPQTPESQNLESSIRESLVDGKLSCEKAWEISRSFDVPKMTVSAVCEQLEIKIIPCQLGAF
ncbi:MAG: hypothetical protein ACR2PH_12550 [Desulfobulbia bacterium]